MKGFEIRRNDDGTIDEVVAMSDDGTLMFHIEQMDKGLWSLGLSDGNGSKGEYHQFDVFRKGKKVFVRSYTDG